MAETTSKLPQQEIVRPRGEFELRGLERLPPTPITEEARMRLLAWGLTESDIKDLQEFTSGFRYDACAEKLQRIAKNKIYLIESDDMQNVTANIAGFYDQMGRLDGQCADISSQFRILTMINRLEERFTERVQKKLGKDYKISIGVMTGKSKTHFVWKEAIHYWNTLGLVGMNGEKYEAVIVDAAMQTIDNLETSGYRPTGYRHHEKEVKRTAMDKSCKVARLIVNEEGVFSEMVPGILLGLSDDRSLIYSIGFAEVKIGDLVDENAQQRKHDQIQNIQPVIGVVDQFGHMNQFVYSPDSSGKLLIENPSVVSAEILEEVKNLLAIANTFDYTFDWGDYPIPEEMEQVKQENGNSLGVHFKI